MFYRVIKDFTDLQDDNHVYHAGDTFPRKGADVDNARLMELSTDANKRGEALLEVVGEDVSDKAPEKAEIEPETAEAEAVDETVNEVKKTPKKGNKKQKEK